MKKLYFLLAFFTCACATHPLQAPQAYQYKEIRTPGFILAAWVKETSATAPFHIYIEGDGKAYNNSGLPSQNPTPKSTLVREMAFEDTAPNVAYLARPCQFVKDTRCRAEDWTTARFSPRAVASTAAAIQRLSKNRPVYLYAYSGGALLSGLVIANYPQIPVKHWTTYAGLLNHSSWTKYKHLAPLTGSLDLQQLPKVPQMHYAGEKDKVIPPELSSQWTNNKHLMILPKVTHRGPFPTHQ